MWGSIPMVLMSFFSYQNSYYAKDPATKPFSEPVRGLEHPQVLEILYIPRDPNSPTWVIFADFRAQCRYHLYTWIPRELLLPPTFRQAFRFREVSLSHGILLWQLPRSSRKAIPFRKASAATVRRTLFEIELQFCVANR